jgi:hypothetical protein
MGKIANEELLQKLGEKFPGQVTKRCQDYGLLTVETGKEQITDVLELFKNRPCAAVYLFNRSYCNTLPGAGKANWCNLSPAQPYY